MKEPKLYAMTGMNLMNMVMCKGSQAQMSTHHVTFIYIKLNREFPGSPVLGLCFSMQGLWLSVPD